MIVYVCDGNISCLTAVSELGFFSLFNLKSSSELEIEKTLFQTSSVSLGNNHMIKKLMRWFKPSSDLSLHG